MKNNLVKIAFRSLLFYRKETFYQVIIISILGAIICGSLNTGDSVRSSLRRNLSEKLGNADAMISSGLRYFDASLADRLTEKSGIRTVSIIETEGYCQNFSSGVTVLGIKVYGIDDTFFPFQASSISRIEKGTALINEKLANSMSLRTGDEIILRYNGIDPLPANAPFAPLERTEGSKVLKVAAIVPGAEAGNFSLGTNQVVPMNIFVNIEDLQDKNNSHKMANRLLIRISSDNDATKMSGILRETITLSDIGMSVRKSTKTGEPELISDRIFIDSAILEVIRRIIPASSPVITYLANSFSVGTLSSPYSFISALPESLYGEIDENAIIINRWLADDLGAKTGDTLTLAWFDPSAGKKLEENTGRFLIQSVTENDSRYSDPSLMPDFPGISGRTTCSSWDAGVPLELDRIRKKDEDYWDRFRGTPKAFISYETGKRLWGNNFGPATALRFPADMDTSQIIERLSGKIDPAVTGFTYTDLSSKNKKAASGGVDFGMLFLSLSFFIIVSGIILLMMALSLFLNSRHDEIKTYHAIGMRNRKIATLIFYETLMITVLGALTGIFLGYIANILIISSLNSVWTGAVQTNTLSPGFSLLPSVTGFLATLMISAVLTLIKLKSFFRKLALSIREQDSPSVKGHGYTLLLLAFLLCVVSLTLSAILSNYATIFAFAGGTFLFVSMVSGVYHFFLRRKSKVIDYSKLYYTFYPAKAITPVIFLAAGIFAVIITGANRQTVSEKMGLPPGGTGGYLLWAESAIPINFDLNSNQGKEEFGFEGEEFNKLSFVQAKRLSGDDASCLNITHVTTPPILGIDPEHFIKKGAFSFASKIKMKKDFNPWSLLEENREKNIIYGIADQTVLQWGLKIKTGDTLKYVSENGQTLNIIICAGLKSSLFQGYLVIDRTSFEKHFPSIDGSSVFLVDGDRESTDLYKETIEERLSGYGISVEHATDKLASFFEVTNTYLLVFMMMGALGMILGVAGLGFILVNNFNSRKREFALMLATGFTVKRIRILLLNDHLLILVMGLLTGSLSAMCATWPSVFSGTELPWRLFIVMLILTFAIGYMALSIAVRLVNREKIITYLRRE
jgi:putative ABC transport system permease protein